MLKSGSKVVVREAADYWEFDGSRKASVALVFLPGASVEPTAYSPLCRAVAEEGWGVYLVKMPPPAGSLDEHKAKGISFVKGIMGGAPSVKKWVVGGHSLGGAIATQFAVEKGSLLAGLVLIGTTHPNRDDLSGLKADVTKVYASNDGVARPDQVKRFEKNLPLGTHWVRIEGGNHAQFGFYGAQAGDGKADIGLAEQQELTRKAAVAALVRVAGR